MIDISSITRLISALRAQTSPNSITPEVLGTILQKIANLIGSLSQVPEQDATDLVARMTQCESDSLTALQAARSAQATADGNVIDSFTHSQDEDELSLSIKQHGHSAQQVVLPAASSTGAGIMTATDKSQLDTAYRKRVNLMSAPSSESVVTLTITFGDGTTKSVTFVGATAGTGGKAGLMTKEQADQLAALVAAGPAESVRDDAGYLKQQYAAPIILRNVTDTVFDDLAIGDVYYDTGHLFYHTEDQSGDLVIGVPSRKVIYYCLADQTLYRWTGSRFVQAVSISSGDVTVPTKLSDLINDMGFLTAHQPLKTINGETITGTGNITIDGAAELKDASNHVKQSMATPVVLRNVTATVFDDLNEGDTYFDSGHLFYHTEGTSGDIDLGTPSKRLIYFCLSNNSFYRWTGSIFSKINSGADIVALNGVSSNQDGTIVFTDTAGNSYTVNLNHTHENMAKLIVCEESELPSTLEKGTIYAQVDNATYPTDIEKLYIAGLEFEKGWVPDPGTAAIKSPSNGTTIDLGEIDQGVASKTIIVRGWNLSGALTVAISGTGLSMNYGNLTGQSSITIPQAAALTGAEVEIVYSGNDGINDGALVISQGNEVLSAVVVKAEDFALPAGYTRLQYVENAVRGIDTGILAVNSQSLTSAIPGTEWDIDVKCDNIPSSPQMIICTNEDIGHWVEAMTDGTFGTGNTDYRIGDITTRTTLHVSWKSNGVTISCNGESRTRAYTYQNVHNVCLFRNINANQQQYEGYQFTGKVYSIRCTSGGSFDGVPARRNSDNKVGLYDIENDVFYPLS